MQQEGATAARNTGANDRTERVDAQGLSTDDFDARWRVTESELRRTLRRSRADAHDIDDVCQDTAALAWRARDRIGPSEADLIRWCVVVAQRLLRRRRRPLSLAEEPTDPETLASRADVEPIGTERVVEARCELDHIRARLPELPRSEQAAVIRRLLELPSGATKREQDASAAALARARRRLGRFGTLGPVWRTRRRARSRPARVAAAVSSAMAAVAAVGFPVALTTSVLTASPQPAAYAGPAGYTQARSHHAGSRVDHSDNAEPAAPRGEERATVSPEPGCVKSIVETWTAVDAEARWAAAALAVAQAAPDAAKRLPRLDEATPVAGEARAQLEARAEDLLAQLTAPQLQVVCRQVADTATVPR